MESTQSVLDVYGSQSYGSSSGAYGYPLRSQDVPVGVEQRLGAYPVQLPPAYGDEQNLRQRAVRQSTPVSPLAGAAINDAHGNRGWFLLKSVTQLVAGSLGAYLTYEAGAAAFQVGLLPVGLLLDLLMHDLDIRDISRVFVACPYVVAGAGLTVLAGAFAIGSGLSTYFLLRNGVRNLRNAVA